MHMGFEYNIRGILHAFFRQKYKIFFIFLLFAFLGAFIVTTSNDMYKAQGGMLVKFGEEARPDVNLSGERRANKNANYERKEVLDSYIRILKSQALLGEVVTKMGIEKIHVQQKPSEEKKWAALSDEEKLQITAANVLEDLNVINNGTNTIIDIYYTHADPLIASELVNTLMEAFIAKQANIYDTAQTKFLDEQSTAMKSRVESAREELYEFKSEHGISDIDQEMAQLLKQKSELISIAYNAVSDARQSLAEARGQAAQDRNNYRSQSALQKKANQAVGVARQNLDQREKDLNSLVNGEESELGQKVDSINQRIAELEAYRGQYNELQQNLRLNEENYRYYKQRGEEARVNNLLNAQNITRITIIDPALTPPKPIGRPNAIILLAFLLAGLSIGLFIGFAFEFMDERFSTPEQIAQALGVPVIANFERTKLNS